MAEARHCKGARGAACCIHLLRQLYTVSICVPAATQQIHATSAAPVIHTTGRFPCEPLPLPRVNKQAQTAHNHVDSQGLQQAEYARPSPFPAPPTFCAPTLARQAQRHHQHRIVAAAGGAPDCNNETSIRSLHDNTCGLMTQHRVTGVYHPLGHPLIRLAVLRSSLLLR